MAALTVQKAVLTGVAPTFVAAAGGGDTFVNDGETYLEVKNAGGSGITVTVSAQSACNQGTLHDSVTTVPATTGDRVIGPFNTTRFNNSAGSCSITYSGVTSVTVAVVSVLG
jgi:hypothetical protein